jgi:flagellar basal-body rod modification protein FlgD
VQLKFVHQTGQVMQVVEQGQQMAGSYSYRWDGKDAHGNLLPAGLYACELSLDGRPVASKKMVMFR